MCEQLGEEPDPERMPVEDSIFPYEVQLSMGLYQYMPDRWDGMSGGYMGKDWSILPELLEAFKVEDRKEVIYFIKQIEILNMNRINDEVAKQQTAMKANSGSEELYPVNKR